MTVSGDTDIGHPWLRLWLSASSHNLNQCWLEVIGNPCSAISQISHLSGDNELIVTHPFERRWTGSYWFNVCLSFRLWTESCPLCICHDICQIHFYFTPWPSNTEQWLKPSLYVGRLKSIVLETYKCFKTRNPDFLKDMFCPSATPNHTRGGLKLVQLKVNTTGCGLNSFS